MKLTSPHSVSIPDDVWNTLQARIAGTGGSASKFITIAIMEKLELQEDFPMIPPGMPEVIREVLIGELSSLYEEVKKQKERMREQQEAIDEIAKGPYRSRRSNDPCP